MVILVYMIIFSTINYGLIVYDKWYYKKMTSYTWSKYQHCDTPSYAWNKYQYCDIISPQDLEDKRERLARSKF